LENPLPNQPSKRKPSQIRDIVNSSNTGSRNGQSDTNGDTPFVQGMRSVLKTSERAVKTSQQARPPLTLSSEIETDTSSNDVTPSTSFMDDWLATLGSLRDKHKISAAIPSPLNLATDAARARNISTGWSDSGFTMRHKMNKLADLSKHAQWSKAFLQACRVVDNRGIIVFLGPRGTGKTQCATEVGRRHVLMERQVRYQRGREVCMHLREAFGPGNISEIEAIKRLCYPDLLVIDEIDERLDSDFERRSLTLLIDRRYGDMKPTILIGYMDEMGFKDEMGSSVVDRIAETGGILEFGWKSFRK